jgi:hypothetical protein
MICMILKLFYRIEGCFKFYYKIMILREWSVESDKKINYAMGKDIFSAFLFM